MKFNLAGALADLSIETLEQMAEAGAQIKESQRLLDKAGANVVGQCLANQGEFFEFDHYPSGDVYDDEFHAQYYYHSHRPESGEHGHFHTFIRAKGMPNSVKPIEYTGKAKRPTGKDAICHLIAISMDKPGQPMSMFTTNRWVTDETYYMSDEVIRLLDYFKIDHTFPCLATNQWITAMLVLFRPQIMALVKERDVIMKTRAASHPGVDIYEDRDLDLITSLPINIDEQIENVGKALAARRQVA